MTDVIEALDVYMDNLFSGKGMKPLGLCELIKKGTSVQPVHVGSRQHVAINDKYDGMWYHRILSNGSASSEENSFGSKIAKMQTVRIRTVLSTKHKLGETLRYDFANQLPETLSVDGYRLIDVSENINMVEDQEGIYAQEFGAGDYEKHATAWNIHALEYDVSFIKCEEDCCV